MELNAKKITLTISAVFVIFFASIFTKAQTIQLTENDKFQIITEILKKQNLKNAASTSSRLNSANPKNTIYLLEDNLPADSFPAIKNINFEVITQKEINDSTEEVVPYFQFGDFKTKSDSVKVVFSTMSKRSSTSSKNHGFGHGGGRGPIPEYTYNKNGHINYFVTDYSIEYKAKKNLNGWKVKENRIINLKLYDPFGQTPSKHVF